MPKAMARFRLATCAVVALVLSATLAAPALARPRDNWDPAEPDFGGHRGGREYVESPQMTLDEAVGIAQSRFDGEVIAASPSTRDGRAGYRIRMLLPGGRVKTVWVDGTTGRMSDAG